MEDVRVRLRSQLERSAESSALDLRPVFRDPELLVATRDALASLFAGSGPSVILGIESRGFLLGAMVAACLSCGFIEVRKRRRPGAAIEAAATEDSRGAHHVLSIGAGLLTPSDRVVLVDDWIDTGAQAAAAQALVRTAHASWLGVAVVVSEAPQHVESALNVRSLLETNDLP